MVEQINQNIEKLIDFIAFHKSIEMGEVYQSALSLLEVAKQKDHTLGKVVGIWAIAIHQMRQGLYDEAEALITEALEMAEQLDATFYKGRLLSLHGSVYLYKGQWSRAVEYLTEALQFIDPFWVGSTYNSLGVVYRKQNRFEDSDKFLQKAVQNSKDQNNNVLESTALLNLGRNKLLQENYLEAIPILNEAIEQCEDYKYWRGKAYGLLYLVLVYKELKEYGKAKKLNTDLIFLTRQEKLNFVLAVALEYQGNLLFKAGNYDEGQVFLKDALKIADKNDYNGIRITTMEELALYYERKGDLATAYEYTQRTLAAYKEEYDKKDYSALEKRLFDREEQIIFLEKQRDLIAKQNEELKQYAYIVAHDLKEPLRNIVGFISLVDRQYQEKLDDTGKEYLKYIREGAFHLHKQLEDLLIYATLEELPKTTESIDLNEVVEKVKSQFIQTIRNTNATIISDKLPSVTGIEVHFKQIFQNLIHNALKFKHADRPPIVKIGLEENDANYIISIADNGVGIQQKYHNLIFKIFKRLDRINYSGTGIGLAICQKAAQLYGGKIWLESEAGEGSTFFVSISKRGFLSPLNDMEKK